jgi:glycosyltransferase involved in cell wall biosynthesis
VKWLFSTACHHNHARQTALALLEKDWLGEWRGSMLFSANSRSLLGKLGGSRLASSLQRRIIDEIPSQFLRSSWGLEPLRMALSRVPRCAGSVDWLWEREEWRLDRWASRRLVNFDGVIGFEHGCLESLRNARKLGKKGVVIFASPHHNFFKTWVEPEARIHAGWMILDEAPLGRKSFKRDARRDDEMQTADTVVCNSELTKETLVAAGVARDKAKVAPLGLFLHEASSDFTPAREFRFLYAGPISLRKGFAYLQEAFLSLKGSAHSMVLNVYGGIHVQAGKLTGDPRVRFHGNVSYERLRRAFSEADVMIFPTLCDGFGQVVSEALNHGLPVICSRNAGAASFIQDGRNGFLIPPGDVEAISERLEWCLDNRERLHAMRVGAVASAKQWSWKNYRDAFTQALTN